MSWIEDLIKLTQLSDTVHETVAPIIYNARTREKVEKLAKEGTERLRRLRMQGKQAVIRPDTRTSDLRARDNKETDYRHQQYQKLLDDLKRAEGLENLIKLSSPSTYVEAATGEQLTPGGRLATDALVFGIGGAAKNLLTRGGSKAVSRSVLGQAKGINGKLLNPKNLGKYLDEGSEQTVYDGGDIVYKVYDQGAVFPTGEDLDRFVASYLKRNDFPLLVPVKYEGYIKGPRPGLPNLLGYFPVFSLKKVQPVTESWETLEPKVNDLLRKNGYNDTEEVGVFSNNKHTLIDILPANMGLDNGELRFIDIGVEPKYFSTKPVTKANPVHTMEGNPLATRLTRLREHTQYGFTPETNLGLMITPLLRANNVRNFAKQIDPSLTDDLLDLIVQIAYANGRGVHIPIGNNAGTTTGGLSIVDIQDAINYLKLSGIKNITSNDIGIIAGHEAGHGVQISNAAKKAIEEFPEPEEFYTRAGQVLDAAGIKSTANNRILFNQFMNMIDDYLAKGNLDNGVSAIRDFLRSKTNALTRQLIMKHINELSAVSGTAYLLGSRLYLHGGSIQQHTYNAGTLPNVVVTGQRRAPYRSYYQEANDKIIEGIKHGTKKAIGAASNALGAMIYYPLAAAFSLQNINKEDSYKNATVPYGKGSGHERDNIINVRNGKSGERDRLGMYGAERSKDGTYRFRNPNYVPAKDKDLQELKAALGFGNSTDLEFLLWCAENSNRLNQSLGRPTAGDAWTRRGIYGDSSIVEAPYKKSDYWFGGEGVRAKHLASDQGEYVANNIDKHDLMTGDIVDMYYKGSDFLNRAFREGADNRTNSHTGTILRTGKDREHTYVVHSTGNGLKVQPIGELLGSGMFKKSYITGIRRPGTKSHPYKTLENKK